MKLLKAKSSSIPNQLWLVFDNGQYLPFFADDWIKLKLKPPVDLAGDLFQQLVDLSLFFQLKQYSLNQIALSPKVKEILVPKLKLKYAKIKQKYNIDTNKFDEIINNILDYLNDHGLLDSQSYFDYILKKFSHKPQVYIHGYLRSKGIKFSSFDLKPATNDLQLLSSILSKPKYQNLKNATYAEKQRLISSLIRKGFAYNDIKSLVDSGASD